MKLERLNGEDHRFAAEVVAEAAELEDLRDGWKQKKKRASGDQRAAVKELLHTTTCAVVLSTTAELQSWHHRD